MSLPGIYRARAVKLDGKALTTYVPQIFGDTSIAILDIAGDPPPTFPAMGWVAFQSGLAEAPVWLGVPTGSDDRYVNVEGDEMTGILRSNRTGTANVDGAIHIEILSAGSQIGRITRATSTTAGFLTSSDEDLKQNFASIDDDLAMLWMTTVTPWFFEYKDRPDVRHVGYRAQQVAEQWPNGVANGIITPGWGDVNARTWDAVGNETTPRGVWQAWMMDHSKITPILHACLLTLDRKITSRFTINGARIAALEETVAQQAVQITDLQQTLAQLRTDVFNTRRFAAYWQFSNTTTAPPGAGQMRTSTDNLTLWLHKIDTDGYDRSEQFNMLNAGVEFAVRSTNGQSMSFHTSGAPTNNGTYYTFPTTLPVGSVNKGVRVELTLRTGIWAEPSPPAPTLLPA